LFDPLHDYLLAGTKNDQVDVVQLNNDFERRSLEVLILNLFADCEKQCAVRFTLCQRQFVELKLTNHLLQLVGCGGRVKVLDFHGDFSPFSFRGEGFFGSHVGFQIEIMELQW
jgi:hypothetical protein